MRRGQCCSQLSVTHYQCCWGLCLVQWSTHSSNSSVFNRWKSPTLAKVIHPSETLVGWRYFLIFSEWPQFFLTKLPRWKRQRGSRGAFPPWPTNQLAKFFPQMSFAIKMSSLALVEYCFLYSNMIIAFQYCRLPTTTPTRKLKRVIAMELCHTNTTSGLNLDVGQEMTAVCSFAEIEWVVVVWGLEEGRADVLEWLEGHLTCEHTSFAHLYCLLSTVNCYHLFKLLWSSDWNKKILPLKTSCYQFVICQVPFSNCSRVLPFSL